MHKLLLLFCLLFSINSFSQATKIKIKKEKEKPEKPVVARPYHYGSLDLYYGNRAFNKNYYNQLNTIGRINLKAPATIVGIGWTGGSSHIIAFGRVFNNDGVVTQVNYYKIIPTRINIEDSLSTKFSGYVFGCGLGIGFSTRKKNVSITAYLGFNTGRTTLSKNKFITQKNQFFSPKIMIQPKFIIKRFAISFIVEAEYDVSNPAWKQTIFEKKEPHLLQPFHQTCFTGLISVGYRPY